jgi:GNAT superfamily N-acetyltransferase
VSTPDYLSHVTHIHALHPVDPLLVKGWLTARSVARGLPPPVPDYGGLRVDTALPNETRRYVFARPTDGLRELAKAVSLPRIFLKLCGCAEEMRALAPSRWQIQSASYMMTYEGEIDGQIQLPEGYAFEISKAGSVTTARILAPGDDIAASGFAAEVDGVFIYDRIVTDAAHRRRGLGRAIMAALGSTRHSSAAKQVLVATEDGRELYSRLGWTIHSPYTTAVIPFDEA